MPALITLIVLGQIPFVLFVALVAVVAINEYLGIVLARRPGARSEPAALLLLVSGPAVVIGAHCQSAALLAALLAANFLLAGVLSTLRYATGRPVAVETLACQVLGSVYVALPLALIVLIRQGDHGAAWVFWLLFLVFFGDIGAFYAGSYAGRHKLCPAVSPKKTVEGALGGLAASVLAGSVFKAFFPLASAMGRHPGPLPVRGHPRAAGRPVRIDAQAHRLRQGFRSAAARPRRYARPYRRPALRRAGCLFFQGVYSLMPKRLAILGSTGSIGTSTLEVVRRFPDDFTVAALTAARSVDRLAEQVIEFRPALAVMRDAVGAAALRRRLPADLDVEVLFGADGYRAAAAEAPADMVVAAMVGAVGLLPTLAAIEAGRDVALANKETLVMAGELVMARAAARRVRILPVDSEHSAIFQCLAGNDRQSLERIVLTASGGPFRQWPAERFGAIDPDTALRHPNWQMGPKITIDSATLMNKGLEVIEARHLFAVAPEHIEVLVHPQSIVHSMVAYVDGSVIAQLGIPDMKGAIAYALSHPRRLPLGQPLPDFAAIGALTFEAPDMERFVSLRLAYEACRCGGCVPAVLNAANEVAVEAFLSRRIAFTDIPRRVAEALEAHRTDGAADLEDILAAGPLGPAMDPGPHRGPRMIAACG